MRTRIAALVVALLAAAPAGTLAQVARPPALKDVFVRSTDGVEVRARLLDLQPLTLSLFVDGSRRDLPIESVDRIQTRGDSVWNGALIGAAIGAGLWGVTAARHEGIPLSFVAGAALGYGLLGAGVDALIPGRTTIYSRPSPAVSQSRGKRAGMSVRIGF